MKKVIISFYSFISQTENSKYILFTGICLVVLSPLLFTLKFNWINFTSTGNIGDTIGGLTAPITSLIGSYLVFIAFKEQLKANELILVEARKNENRVILAQNISNYTNQIKFLREDIDTLTFYSVVQKGSDKERTLYSGVNAVGKVFDLYCREAIMSLNTTENYANPALIFIEKIMDRFVYLAININVEDFGSEKDSLLKSLSFTYESKIFPYIINCDIRSESKIDVSYSFNKNLEILIRIFDLYEIFNSELKIDVLDYRS